jgi:hypothetical protein
MLWVALALVGCTAGGSADNRYCGRIVPPTGDILRVGNGAEPKSFDPKYPGKNEFCNYSQELFKRCL